MWKKCVPICVISLREAWSRPQVSDAWCVTSSQGNVDQYVALSRLPAGDRDSRGNDVGTVPLVNSHPIDGDDVVMSNASRETS